MKTVFKFIDFLLFVYITLTLVIGVICLFTNAFVQNLSVNGLDVQICQSGIKNEQITMNPGDIAVISSTASACNLFDGDVFSYGQNGLCFDTVEHNNIDEKTIAVKGGSIDYSLIKGRLVLVIPHVGWSIKSFYDHNFWPRFLTTILIIVLIKKILVVAFPVKVPERRIEKRW